MLCITSHCYSYDNLIDCYCQDIISLEHLSSSVWLEDGLNHIYVSWMQSVTVCYAACSENHFELSIIDQTVDSPKEIGKNGRGFHTGGAGYCCPHQSQWPGESGLHFYTALIAWELIGGDRQSCCWPILRLVLQFLFDLCCSSILIWLPIFSCRP